MQDLGRRHGQVPRCQDDLVAQKDWTDMRKMVHWKDSRKLTRMKLRKLRMKSWQEFAIGEERFVGEPNVLPGDGMLGTIKGNGEDLHELTPKDLAVLCWLIKKRASKLGYTYKTK
eukprot:1522137-Amphidinium_carterae.1